MKIAIIGTGYVGLTTGICLAEMGHDVLCMDIDQKKIENLRQGKIPIYEPGLEELLASNNLTFSTNIQEAIEFGEVIFSAVGTPMGQDHKADLKYVKAVAKSFCEHANEYKVFVNKSTVPVGTAEMCRTIIQEQTDQEFDIVSNPEFLREGTAVDDTLHPDRIVLGTDSEKAKEKLIELYEKNKDKILFTDIKSAEIIKYASNAFLATKISYINEMANFCEKAGGNIHDVAKGMGLDSRIGSKFLRAGIGYGGSCFPKDVQAFIETGKEHGHNFEIIQATEEVNRKQKSLLFHKLRKHISDLNGKTIALLGLSFKPHTDDMREAPSLTIAKLLAEEGAKIQAYDPASKHPLNNCASAEEAAQNADALLLITEWPEFQELDWSKIASSMNTPLLLDGRNFLKNPPPEFTYESIGK
ncbi:UDP-glucose/GDP-mannose dehydrogenase family protein [Candidatus Gracilibacteria bacterium]|nr:UDP-glucose/GDP-mannose dehydrogenase family protein [Candidatus Gracilibacteria bacterium]